jgi:hypothetical protein
VISGYDPGMASAPRIIHMGSTPTGEEVAVIEDAIVGRPFLVTFTDLPTDDDVPGGRVQIQSFHVFKAAGHPAATRTLAHKIGASLDRVEAVLNNDDLRERMIQRLLTLHADTKTLTQPRTIEQNWQAYLTERVEPEPARPRRRSLRLRVPETKKFPDSFYERVAGLYSEVLAEGGRPASAIAAANELPLSTVHTWVREARRRGMLPPGRAGKAG